MKKNKAICGYCMVLLFTLITVITGYSQALDFKFGSSQMKPFFEDDVEIVTINNGEYYTISKKGFLAGELNPKVTLEQFNKQHERLYAVDVTSLPQYDFVDLIVSDNKAYLLESLFKKEEQKNVLLAYEITGNSKSSKPIELAYINAEKLGKKGKFIASQSPDKNHLLVIGQPEFVKGENEKIDVFVYDNKLAKKSQTNYTFPYEFARVVDNNPLINDKAEVFIVKKTDTKNSANPYSIFNLYKNQKWSEYKIELGGEKKIVIYKTAFSSNGDLFIGGYFTEDGKVVFGGSKFNGAFMCKAVANNLSTTLINTASFADKKKNLVLRNLLVDELETVYLVSETVVEDIKVVQAERPANNPNAFFKDPVRNYRYFVDFIYVDAIPKTGMFLFNYSLHRPLETENDYNITSSTFSTLYKDQILLLFNDYYENRYDGKKKIVVFNPTKTLVQQTLDKKTGEIKQTLSLINSQSLATKGSIFIRPSVNKKLNESTFIIRAESKDAYKMGEVTISN